VEQARSSAGESGQAMTGTTPSHPGRARLGADLDVGDRVRWHEREWTVLPLNDGCRWLGAHNGGLVPLLPDENYEYLGSVT
jgi:hypothetical protein